MDACIYHWLHKDRISNWLVWFGENVQIFRIRHRLGQFLRLRTKSGHQRRREDVRFAAHICHSGTLYITPLRAKATSGVFAKMQPSEREGDLTCGTHDRPSEHVVRGLLDCSSEEYSLSAKEVEYKIDNWSLMMHEASRSRIRAG